MIAEVVERWIPRAFVRKDFIGCIDILAFAKNGAESGVIGIQATSLANVSHRVAKAKASPLLPHWLQAGNRFAVHGWGKKKNRWTCKEVSFPLSA